MEVPWPNWSERCKARDSGIGKMSCEIDCLIGCHKICQIGMPDQMAEYVSHGKSDRMPGKLSHGMSVHMFDQMSERKFRIECKTKCHTKMSEHIPDTTPNVRKYVR